MVYKDRHILRIDEYNFKVFEMLDKYVDDELIFPDSITRNISRKKKTHDVLKAVSLGIPLQNIYLCEMQNGQLLVLDSSEKLKYLTEFLCGESTVPFDRSLFFDNRHTDVSIDDIYPEIRQHILRAAVPVRVIRYDTPTYLQMYVGNYTQEFSITQMEYIRRILYSRTGMREIMRTIRNKVGRNSLLVLEYEFVIFMTYIVCFHCTGGIEDDTDYYNLEEIMLYWIDGKQEFVDSMFQEYYESKRRLMNCGRDNVERSLLFHIRTFERNYPAFQPSWGHVLGIAAASCDFENGLGERIIQKVNQLFHEVEIDRRVRRGELREMLNGCDLTIGSIRNIVNYLS